LIYVNKIARVRSSLRQRSNSGIACWSDLHETSDPKYTAQIDTVGWIFVAFALVITAIAAIVGYHGSDTMIANSPTSRRGVARLEKPRQHRQLGDITGNPSRLIFAQ
jgi:hypothetical protein